MIAADVMTRNVLTAGPDTPLSAALALMLDGRVSGLPIVRDDGHLVGILTEGDLLRRSETGTNQRERSKWVEFLLGPGHSADHYVHEHSRRVSDLMTREVVTATEDRPLHDVVGLMERRHIRRVPIVRGERLVGIISRRDLIRALAERLAAIPKAPPSDAAIEAVLTAEIKPQPWIIASNITIAVKDGVVTLGGIISDERCRDGLRVAAQNVPGVKKVEDELVWIDPLGISAYSVT